MDEPRRADRGGRAPRRGGLSIDVLRVGGGRVKRVVYPPGWRWSTHMKPVSGTDHCMHTHVGFLARGRLQGRYADGCEYEVAAPAFAVIEAGHDGWVVGDDPGRVDPVGLPRRARRAASAYRPGTSTVSSAANREAIARVLASDPVLVGVRPAGEVVAGLAPDLILHAAPPAPWSQLSELVRGGLIGAALFEGLADVPDVAESKLANGRIRLGAAQDHDAMAGGAGAITASLPVLVLEDRATGRRATHFLMEGFGTTLILGVVDDTVLDRLAWFRREVGPALDAAIAALGGIELRPLMVEALRRGDELHNRNAAATSMLAERLALGFARAAVDATVQGRILEFLAGNSQFFVACSLAASQLALGAAVGIEGSSLLVACGANGRDCGIKVAGLGDRWFTAPAELPVGPLLAGFGPDDVGPGAVTRCSSNVPGSAPPPCRRLPRSGRPSASTRRGPGRSSRRRSASRSLNIRTTACRSSVTRASRRVSRSSRSSRPACARSSTS